MAEFQTQHIFQIEKYLKLTLHLNLLDRNHISIKF